MEKRTKILTAVAAVFVIASTGVAFAKDHGGGRMGHMANPEAIAACANQTEGANVVFNHPMWGNVNAVCGKTRDNKLLAMPAKMVEHMKQAVAACAGKKDGDKVSISDMRDATKTIDAVCDQRGDVLAAHPEHKRGDNKGGMRHSI